LWTGGLAPCCLETESERARSWRSACNRTKPLGSSSSLPAPTAPSRDGSTTRARLTRVRGRGFDSHRLDDRFKWLTGLLGDLFNLDDYLGQGVSEETVRSTWNAAAEAAPVATWACPPGWLEDFSEDIKRIDVPTLILHGPADRILPIDGQGRRLHAALPDARYVEIEGGPHVLCVTHANEVNQELLAFLRQPAPVGAAA
jgi:pimeloyl-ACP methyl ester carboxylesterase